MHYFPVGQYFMGPNYRCICNIFFLLELFFFLMCCFNYSVLRLSPMVQCSCQWSKSSSTDLTERFPWSRQIFPKQDTKAIINHMMAHTQESEQCWKVAQIQNSHVLKTTVVVYRSSLFVVHIPAERFLEIFQRFSVGESLPHFSPGALWTTDRCSFCHFWEKFQATRGRWRGALSGRRIAPSSDLWGWLLAAPSLFLVSTATKQQLHAWQDAYAISHPIARPL